MYPANRLVTGGRSRVRCGVERESPSQAQGQLLGRRVLGARHVLLITSTCDRVVTHVDRGRGILAVE